MFNISAPEPASLTHPGRATVTVVPIAGMAFILRGLGELVLGCIRKTDR